MMKKTNKVFALLLSALMLVSLAACGGGSKDVKDAAKKLSDDTAVMGMSFTAPEGYETIERSVEKTADGKLMSKGISYTLPDSCALAFAYTIAEGRNLNDELKEYEEQDKVQRKEYNGTELILYQSGKKSRMALYQDGEDVYGVQYRASSEETIDEEFDRILQNVKYKKTTKTTLNDVTLGNVKYSLELDVPLYSETISITAKPDGSLVSESFIWKFGKDSENTDYRFGIELKKDTKLEELLKEDKEYEEKKIGNVTYTFEKVEEGGNLFDRYAFYVQSGEDVYLVQNKGVSNGWLVSRSDESKKAFETFLKSVKIG